MATPIAPVQSRWRRSSLAETDASDLVSAACYRLPEAEAHHARTNAQPTSSYSGYYDSTVPEGNYTTYANPASGSVSSAIGNIGR
jgi:hypothetical protein